MFSAIWYNLYNLKNVKTTMEDSYSDSNSNTRIFSEYKQTTLFSENFYSFAFYDFVSLILYLCIFDIWYFISENMLTSKTSKTNEASRCSIIHKQYT